MPGSPVHALLVRRHGVIYANLDLESKRWYDHRAQGYWPELVVKSASAP
jgi:hypothetical protein